MSAQINLAPETQYALAARQRRRKLYFISLIIVIIFVAVLGSLLLYKRVLARQLSSLDTDIATLETEIARLGPDVSRVQLFEGRLDAYNELLVGHRKQLSFLLELEKLLPAPTILKEVTFSHSRKVFEVHGSTPNIDLVAQTLASLANPGRSNVFTSGDIQVVTREVEKDNTGAVFATNYIFSIIFQLK